MEEYVVDVSPLRELYEKIGHDRSPFTQIANCPINGSIVRCKDCKYAEDMTKLHGSWFCNRNVCAKPPIEPDGFCSWAEVKMVE